MTAQNIFYHIFILSVFALLAGCSSTAEQQIAAAPLFPERHSRDLKQVSISDFETTLDFKRVDRVWVVGNDNRLSDEPRVTAFVDKLVTLAPQIAAAIVPDRFKDFKVGDDSFTRRVVLTFKDNNSYILLIGTPSITKPVYIRLAGNNLVYKVDEPLLMQISLNVDSWLAPEEG
jgi:hypothetical protein